MYERKQPDRFNRVHFKVHTVILRFRVYILCNRIYNFSQYPFDASNRKRLISRRLQLQAAPLFAVDFLEEVWSRLSHNVDVPMSQQIFLSALSVVNRDADFPDPANEKIMTGKKKERENKALFHDCLPFIASNGRRDNT